MKAFAVFGLLAILAGSSSLAQSAGYFTSGEVVFMTASADEWVYLPGFPWATGTGWLLISKAIPYAWPGWFIVTQPGAVLFHDGRTISFWDGVVRSAVDPGKGYDDLFVSDAELGEFAPIRSGHFLVAERWADVPRRATLVEFDINGRVGEHPFPDLIDEKSRSLGAEHFEILSDGCTVLYAAGADGSVVRSFVRRLNICTGTREADFAVLAPSQSAGAIRQLRTGEVLVASGESIEKFTETGELVRRYVLPASNRESPAPNVTHIVLSPEGSVCWAAAIDQSAPKLYRFDPYAADPGIVMIDVGNPGMQPPAMATGIHSLVVVGEWRASAAGARSRSVRRR